MINAVIRLGRAQQYLDVLLKSDVFKGAQPTRDRVACLNDNMWFLMNILRGNDES
jgi:hypothetical protein